jgi:hypothetical protein
MTTGANIISRRAKNTLLKFPRKTTLQQMIYINENFCAKLFVFSCMTKACLSYELSCANGLQLFLQLIFTADNGGGEFSTKYTPQASNDLCDSQWHKIEGKTQ